MIIYQTHNTIFCEIDNSPLGAIALLPSRSLKLKLTVVELAIHALNRNTRRIDRFPKVIHHTLWIALRHCATNERTKDVVRTPNAVFVAQENERFGLEPYQGLMPSHLRTQSPSLEQRRKTRPSASGLRQSDPKQVGWSERYPLAQSCPSRCQCR